MDEVEYRLRRGESLPDGVERVFDALTGQALELVADVERLGPGRSVHEIRKRCKESRGLIRLVRPALGPSYTRVNAGLRDAGRVLSPFRDPQALLGTFDALVAAAPDRIADGGVGGARAALARRATVANDAIVGSERPRLGEAGRLLESARAEMARWSIPDDFEVVAAGVRETYRRGRRCHARCRAEGTPEAFHQWRKRTKYLWYQTRLLEPASPSLLGPLVEVLHDLSDSLGDAHDLTLFADRTACGADDVDDREWALVEALADTFCADLEERALRLGRRVFAEHPRAFTDRLGAYWDAWAEADELAAGEIGAIHDSTDRLSGLGHRELYAMARERGVGGRSAMTRDELERAVRAAGS